MQGARLSYQGSFYRVLEMLGVSLGLLGSAIVLIGLVWPAADVRVGGVEHSVRLITAASLPLEDPGPLASVRLISCSLLVWAFLMLCLGLFLVWRGVVCGWTVGGIGGVYGVLVSLLVSVFSSLLRVFYYDILPRLTGVGASVGGEWRFILDFGIVDYGPYYYLYKRNIILLLLIVLIIINSIVLFRYKDLPPSRLAVLPITLLLFAQVVVGTSYSMRSVESMLRFGQEIIWYEDPGTAWVNVTIDPNGQYANASVWESNLALGVYDGNNTASVLVVRSFVSGSDYSGVLELFNVSWTLLGLVGLDGNSGGTVELGSVNITVNNGSVYHYRLAIEVDVLEPENAIIHYSTPSREGVCAQLSVPEWGASYGIELLFGSGTSSSRVYAGGSLVCTFNMVLDPSSISTIAFELAGGELGAEYLMFVDNVRITLRTSTVTLSYYERYDDGIDDLFTKNHPGEWWLDTHYLTSNGPSRSPLPDGSVALVISGALTTRVLDIGSSLDDGLEIPSRLTLSSSGCRWEYTSHVVPIIVEELTGTARALAWVNITLNATNFQDWNLLSPDGSDIYFTLPDGSVALHYIESIDTANRHAAIKVLIPSIPAYSRTTVYMHYGGVNPYPGSRVSSAGPPAPGVQATPVRGAHSVLAEYLIDPTTGAWTRLDLLVLDGAPLQGNTETITTTVDQGDTPVLGMLVVFSSIPPGSDASCNMSVSSTFNPSPNTGITLDLNHDIVVHGGVSESRLTMATLGLLAGRSESGLDLDSSYIHWVYLNLTTGMYRFRYVDGATVRDATGYAKVLASNFLDLQSMSWSERYALGPLVVFVNPYRGNQTYTITIRDVNGYNYTFTLEKDAPSEEFVLFDIAIAWEDLWWPQTGASLDNYVDHVVRVTVYTNKTARVEILFASGGYLHMFMLNTTLPDFNSIPAIVDEYMANNHQLPASYSVLYVKAHGDVVSKYGGRVWDPVSAQWKTPPLVFRVHLS